MMNSLGSDKDRVSYEAFLEEVESWELTLTRQARKLKSFKGKVYSSLLNNSLDIILTEIDAQTIKYRKIRESKKNYDIIHQYNALSRKFMDIMESIGNFSDQIDSAASFNTTIDLDESINKKDLHPSFQKQTFAYKVNKQPPKQKKTGYSKKSKHISFTQNAVKMNTSKLPLNSSVTECFKGRGMDEQDSWDIRYQLKQIKSMMSQIKNEIKYHNHEELESQIQKIQHSNKKMGLELKNLKQDTQYIIGRIQNIKEQLNNEKKMQTQMIQEFEKNPLTKSKLKSKSVSESRKQPHVEEVSDWVKIRI